MPEHPTTLIVRIPIVRSVGGHRRYAHARRYEQVDEAIIDGRDFDFLSQFTWTLVPKPNGMKYARRGIWTDGRPIWRFMQADVFERHHGSIPDGLTIDHENRDGLDNRPENLRLATTAQQGYNKTAPVHSKTGHKGVHWYQAARAFKTMIRHTTEEGERLRIFLGHWPTVEEASCAYNTGARILHGKFACLNPIPEGSLSEEEQRLIAAYVEAKLIGYVTT